MSHFPIYRASYGCENVDHDLLKCDILLSCRWFAYQRHRLNLQGDDTTRWYSTTKSHDVKP